MDNQLKPYQKEFESWAKIPPREWNLSKYSDDSPLWPKGYVEYSVQCAWEAWEAAYKDLVASMEGKG